MPQTVSFSLLLFLPAGCFGRFGLLTVSPSPCKIRQHFSNPLARRVFFSLRENAPCRFSHRFSHPRLHSARRFSHSHLLSIGWPCKIPFAYQPAHRFSHSPPVAHRAALQNSPVSFHAVSRCFSCVGKRPPPLSPAQNGIHSRRTHPNKTALAHLKCLPLPMQTPALSPLPLAPAPPYFQAGRLYFFSRFQGRFQAHFCRAACFLQNKTAFAKHSTYSPPFSKNRQHRPCSLSFPVQYTRDF